MVGCAHGRCGAGMPPRCLENGIFQPFGIGNMKRILGILAASVFRGVAGAGAADFRFQGGRQIVFLSGACIIGKNGKRAEAASADRFPAQRRFQLRMGAAPNAALIFRLCYRKWLMLFSLKLQKDNRKNVLTVDPAKGKKPAFPPCCGDETTTYYTEPIFRLHKLGINIKAYFKAGG